MTIDSAYIKIVIYLKWPDVITNRHTVSYIKAGHMNNELSHVELYKHAVDSYAFNSLKYHQDSHNHLLITSLISDLRKMAAAGLRVNDNAEEFSNTVQTYVKLQIELIDGYDKDKSKGASFVTMTSFNYGLDAMASGNISLGRLYFNRIGGRHKEEKRNDHPFTRSFGYAIKELSTSGYCTDDRMTELRKYTKQKYLNGYIDIVSGISERDLNVANNGIYEVIKAYPMCVRSGNIFHLTPDANVFFWCAGFINLARSLGLEVNVPDVECIPKCIVSGSLF